MKSLRGNLSYVLVGGKAVHLPVQVDELEPGKDPGGLVRAGVLEVAVGKAVGLARRRHAGEQRHEGVQRGLGGLSAVIVAAAKYCVFFKKKKCTWPGNRVTVSRLFFDDDPGPVHQPLQAGRDCPKDEACVVHGPPLHLHLGHARVEAVGLEHPSPAGHGLVQCQEELVLWGAQVVLRLGEGLQLCVEKIYRSALPISFLNKCKNAPLPTPGLNMAQSVLIIFLSSSRTLVDD